MKTKKLITKAAVTVMFSLFLVFCGYYNALGIEFNTPVTIWQIGQFDDSVAEFSETEEFHDVFNYAVDANTDNETLGPQFPGHLYTSLYPTLTGMTAREVHISFTCEYIYTDVTLYYKRFGSDIDDIMLDGRLVESFSGAEETHEIDLDTLAVGEHTLSIIYVGNVVDNGNHIDALKLEGTATEPNGTPPIASFSVSPTSGTVETLFSVDASGSYDVEDAADMLEVRWDFESDGIWDTVFSTDKTADNQYAEEGAYTITLEVKDSDGLTDTAVRQVTVAQDACLKFDLLEGRAEEPSKVYLFFSLRNCSGEPRDGLSADDFEIFEDDEYISEYESDQTILPSPKLYTMSTVVLLDVSGSILGADALPSVKTSAKAFIDAVAGEDGQEVAVYLFDGREDLLPVSAFTKDTTELHAAIDALSQGSITSDPAYDKSTNLNGAVRKGLTTLDNRRQSIDSEALFTGSLVVFTDGTDRAERVSDSSAASAVAVSDHAVFSIGLGGEIDEYHLRKLGKDRFLWAENVGELNASFGQIAAAIDSESKKYYVLGYCSPKRAGSHTVTLQVKGHDGELDFAFSAQGFGPGCSPEAIESILYKTENVQIEEEGCFEADFAAGPVSGTAPLSVRFSNQSAENSESYYWDFGDGAKSYEQNPSHTYTEPGTYTVKLVIDGYECSQENIVSVLPAIVDTDQCPAEYAMQGVSGADESLNALRNYRDTVLAKSDRGAMLIKLYYLFSDKVVEILKADPSLSNAIADLISKLAPQIKRMESGQKPTLQSDDVTTIQSVLSTVSDASNSHMRIIIKIVSKGLNNKTFLNAISMSINT